MDKIKKPIIETTDSVVSFETFNKPGNYEINNWKKDKPTCFNGVVNIKKYKITVEPVEETIEVYTERLQKLWDECDNYHHWRPLEEMAKSYGIKLQGSAGSKKQR